MIASLLRSKIAIVGIVIVIAGGLWYGLSSSSSSGPAGALTSTGPDTSGDQSIVSTLLTLQSITLSGTIFSNPAYSTLKDFTTAIVPEPAGRPDPFAPLPVSSPVPNADASKSVQIFQPAKK
jgi:hypothetical protein